MLGSMAKIVNFVQTNIPVKLLNTGICMEKVLVGIDLLLHVVPERMTLNLSSLAQCRRLWGYMGSLIAVCRVYIRLVNMYKRPPAARSVLPCASM